jgi:hypothetical protein
MRKEQAKSREQAKTPATDRNRPQKNELSGDALDKVAGGFGQLRGMTPVSGTASSKSGTGSD